MRHLALLALLLIATAAEAGSVGAALTRAAEGDPDSPVTVWIHFTDRAGAEKSAAAFAAAKAGMTPKALARRRARGTLPDVVASDLPVHEPYVNAVVARGATLRGTSRWLNAASVRASAGLAVELAKLPFVESVDLVPVGRVSRDPEPFTADPEPQSVSAPAQVLAPGDPSFYGATYKQNLLMQTPQLHAAGVNGAGVLVCILDAGFRTTHQIFTGLNVLARRDFVNNDSIVDDQVPPDAAGDGSHGTSTLACIAGFKNGTYVGTAYGCQVALGKTEYVATETPTEMDNWQRGAEWADSLGADVLSSSLGYLTFDSPFIGYTQADLDGQTTVVTRAAQEATKRGIVVVTAAGNEGPTSPSLIGPADADTVITVGAVDSMNVITGFSSRGPTADGRIKPDVVAMGRAVYLPQFTSTTGFGRASGTSFATPLTAGVAALILQVHPTWGPFEVREAMRETALNHTSPNNDLGWGLVQGFAASQWVPSTVGVEPGEPALALSAGPNPFHAGASQAIRFSARGEVALDAFDLRGRRVARVFAGVANGPTAVSWRGTKDDGERLPAGMYWLKLSGNIPAAQGALRVVLLP